MRLTIGLLATLVALLAGAGTALAQSEEELRAEAHRTVFRRLSEGATTAKIGLPAEAARFVDLWLDLGRNVDAVQRGEAPPSTRFMGTPHHQFGPEDGALILRACFVELVIDEVKVPFAELLPLAEAALDPAKFRLAARPADDAALFESWRVEMLGALLSSAGRSLAAAPEFAGKWKAIEVRIEEAIVAALDQAPDDAFWPLLSALQTVESEDLAAKLITRAGALPKETVAWRRDALVSTVCRMPGAAAAAWRKSLLASRDPLTLAGALMGVTEKADDETVALVAGILADAAQPVPIRQGAVTALEMAKTPRALKALEERFAAETDGSLKYNLACALLRAGSEASVPYLTALLAALEKKPDEESQGVADYIRTLLENRGK